MLPRTLGLAAGQVNLLVITIISSGLAAGSIAIFNLANNLQSLPVSLFAVSLAIAVFPTFTQAINDDNNKKFADNFSSSLRKILFLLIPISILIIVLRAQFVRVVLGSGAFDWNDTILTANTLGWFAVSIFAQGLIPLLARSFYAFEDTKTPMIISMFSIILNIVLSFILSAKYSVIGLAMAFSISSIVNMILLYISLHKKVKNISDGLIFSSLFKITFNSILSGILAYITLNLLAPFVDMHTFLGIFTQGLIAGSIGLITYIILGIVFRLDEVDIIKRLLQKVILLMKNGRN